MALALASLVISVNSISSGRIPLHSPLCSESNGRTEAFQTGPCDRMAKVIDTHAHLGECCDFGLLATEEEMFRRMDKNGVDDATIVQPNPDTKDFLTAHDEIADLCVKGP